MVYNCFQIFINFCSFITSDCFGISGPVSTATVCTNPFSTFVLFLSYLVKAHFHLTSKFPLKVSDIQVYKKKSASPHVDKNDAISLKNS